MQSAVAAPGAPNSQVAALVWSRYGGSAVLAWSALAPAAQRAGHASGAASRDATCASTGAHTVMIRRLHELVGRPSEWQPRDSPPKAAVNVANIVLAHALAEARYLIQKAGHWIGATAVTIGREGGRLRVLASTSSPRQKQAGGSIAACTSLSSRACRLFPNTIAAASSTIIASWSKDHALPQLMSVALAWHGPLQN